MPTGPTTFIPVVVKLDSSQLDAFEAQIKRIKVSLSGAETSATMQRSIQSQAGTAKKVEEDFLRWKSEQANKAYREAEQHLKQMTAARIAAERKVAAEAAKVQAEEAKKGGVSFGGFGIPGVKFSGEKGAAVKADLGVAMLAAGQLTALGAIIVKVTKDWAQYGSEIYHVHQQTGISSQDLSVLRLQAQQNGIEFDKLTTGLKFFSKQLYDLEAGSKKTEAVFKSIHVTVKDVKDANGQLLPVLNEVANKVAAAGSSFEKSAIATKFFGRGVGPETITFLNSLAGTLEHTTKMAEEMGLVFDDVAAQKAYEFQKQAAMLEMSLKGVEMELGRALAPVLLNLMRNIYPILTGLGKWIEQNQQAIVSAVQLAGAFGIFVMAVKGASAALALLGVEAGLASGGLTILLGLLAVLAASNAIDKLTSDISGLGSQMNAIQPTGVAFQKMFEGIIFQAKNAQDELKMTGIMTQIMAQEAIEAAAKMRAAGLLSEGIKAKTSFYKAGGAGIGRLPAGATVSTAPGGQTVVIEPSSTVDPHVASQYMFGPKSFLSRFTKPDLSGASEATKQYVEAQNQASQAAIKEGELRDQLTKGYKSEPTKITPVGTGKAAKAVKDFSSELTNSAEALKNALENRLTKDFQAYLATQRAFLKDDLDQRLIAQSTYYDLMSDLAKNEAKREIDSEQKKLNQLEADKKTYEAKLKAAKTGPDRDKDQIELNKIETKIEEQRGKISEAEIKRQNELRQIEHERVLSARELANAQTDSAISLQKLYGGYEKFSATAAEIDKQLKSVTDQYGQEAKKGNEAAIATIKNAQAHAQFSKVLNDLEKNEYAYSAALKTRSLDEVQLEDDLKLGLISELQYRDQLIQIQERSRPVIQARLDFLNKEIAANKQLATPERLAEIRELTESLRMLGQTDSRKDLGLIWHQMDIEVDHLNDGLIKMLANTKSLQQTLEDMRTNLAKIPFDFIDQQIDKLMAKLPKSLGFLKEFLSTSMKDLAHLGIAQFEKKAFGIEKPEEASRHLASATQANTSATISNTSAMNRVAAAIGSVGAGGAGAAAGGAGAVGAAGAAMDAAKAAAEGGAAPTMTSVHEAAAAHEAIHDLSSVPGVGKALGVATKAGGFLHEASGILGRIPGLGGAGGLLSKGIFGKLGLGGAAGKGILGQIGGMFGLGGGAAGGAAGAAGSAAMFSNPFTAALAIAPIAIPLIAGLFGGGDAKKVHDAIKASALYRDKTTGQGLDIKDSKILDQIVQIGQQNPAYHGHPGNYAAQLIAQPDVKQIIDQYSYWHLWNNTKAADTATLTDINNAQNVIRRAGGGGLFPGVPTVVGERRAELITPSMGGYVHRSAEDAIGDISARISARLSGASSGSIAGQTGGGHQSIMALHGMIQATMSVLARLTQISPGNLVMMGANQNPGAFSAGAIEGLRGNFDHRRELNLLTGS